MQRIPTRLKQVSHPTVQVSKRVLLSARNKLDKQTALRIRADRVSTLIRHFRKEQKPSFTYTHTLQTKPAEKETVLAGALRDPAHGSLITDSLSPLRTTL